MKYTVRFAHLESAPLWKVGDLISTGYIIGKMGTSGQSTAKHLHIDCAEGIQSKKYSLSDFDTIIKPSPRQLLYFIDKELFRDEPIITTPYADHEYFVDRKKVHHGFDVVPENRHQKDAPLLIYWNRSAGGVVLKILDDPEGYGHCIMIGFES